MLSLPMSCVRLKHLSSAIRSILYHRPVSKTTIDLSVSVLETSSHQCRDFKEFKQILCQMILTGLIKDAFAAKRLLQFSTRDLPFIHVDYSYQIFNFIENLNASFYNIMMMAYVRRNYPHRAIPFYKLMLYRKVGPNVYTYPFLVEACSIRKSELEGKQMHNHVLKLGFDSDVHVRSTFVDMYAKNYMGQDALKVFNEGPFTGSFVSYSLFKRCMTEGALTQAEYIYNMTPKDKITSNLLIVSFWCWGLYGKVNKLTNEIPKNDTVTWSALIKHYQSSGWEFYHKAFDLFVSKHANGLIRIDELVVEAVLHCCTNFATLGDITMMGKLIHSVIVKIGIECDVELQNSLICMYSECGQMLSAQNLFNAARWLDKDSWYSMLDGYVECGLDENVKTLFESMPQKDPLSYRMMMSYYSQRDCFSESLTLFESMPQKDPLSYRMMMSYYSQRDCFSESLTFFHKMLGSGTRLNIDTWYEIITDLPARFAAADLGKGIHGYLIKNGYCLRFYGDLSAALCRMYRSSCGYEHRDKRGFY